MWFNTSVFKDSHDWVSAITVEAWCPGRAPLGEHQTGGFQGVFSLWLRPWVCFCTMKYWRYFVTNVSNRFLGHNLLRRRIIDWIYIHIRDSHFFNWSKANNKLIDGMNILILHLLEQMKNIAQCYSIMWDLICDWIYETKLNQLRNKVDF